MTDDPTWNSSEFKDEKTLLDSVYGKIFGGDAINYIDTKIKKWAQIKADELLSNIDIKENSIVLDFGCGPCFIAKEVKNKLKCKKVICYDVNEDQLKYAKNKHGDYLKYIKYDEKKGIMGQVMDNSIDLVYSFAVFIHYDLYMFVETFEALQKKVKKDGFVYLQFLKGEHFDPDCPTWREHYNIWKKRRNFWTMAMHHNSEKSIIKIAEKYGFKQIELKGHAGVPCPSKIDEPFVKQTIYNNNILFQKI